MRDCSFQFSIAADIRHDAERQLRQNYDADRIEDVVQEGILYFATSRSAAALAETSRQNQIHQLVQDCKKAAKERLGGDFWTIDEGNAWSKKKAERTVEEVHLLPAELQNLSGPDSKIEAFETAHDAVARLNAIVDFCRRHKLSAELVMMALKYNNEGMTDKEIAEQTGRTLNEVQKTYRRVGRLFSEEQEMMQKEKSRNAKTPAPTGVRGESRCYA